MAKLVVSQSVVLKIRKIEAEGKIFNLQSSESRGCLTNEGSLFLILGPLKAQISFLLKHSIDF